jgi:hypothetical protein
MVLLTSDMKKKFGANSRKGESSGNWRGIKKGESIDVVEYACT